MPARCATGDPLGDRWRVAGRHPRRSSVPHRPGPTAGSLNSGFSALHSSGKVLGRAQAADGPSWPRSRWVSVRRLAARPVGAAGGTSTRLAARMRTARLSELSDAGWNINDNRSSNDQQGCAIRIPAVSTCSKALKFACERSASRTRVRHPPGETPTGYGWLAASAWTFFAGTADPRGSPDVIAAMKEPRPKRYDSRRPKRRGSRPAIGRTPPFRE
jgi:hypothetical protein